MKIESKILVFLVLLILGLASYNIFYRNALVPLQREFGFDFVVISNPHEKSPSIEKLAPSEIRDLKTLEENKNADFRGGFGEPKTPEENEDADFRGGFGAPKTSEEHEDADFRGGFGEPKPSEENKNADFRGGFGDPKTPEENESNEALQPKMSEKPAKPATQIRSKNTFATFIDAIKLDWIDVFLRNLVLLLAFLGAMIATQKRKHISIDAFSQLLGVKTRQKTQLFTNLLTVLICLLLARSGAELVAIGLEFPKLLVSWLEEWVIQLIFPIGFVLLAFHFLMRAFENIQALQDGDSLGPVPITDEATEGESE